MVECVATGNGPGYAPQSLSCEVHTDPPPELDHLYLAWFTALIWIESLTCRKEMATRSPGVCVYLHTLTIVSVLIFYMC